MIVRSDAEYNTHMLFIANETVARYLAHISSLHFKHVLYAFEQPHVLNHNMQLFPQLYDIPLTFRHYTSIAYCIHLNSHVSLIAAFRPLYIFPLPHYSNL